MSRTENLLQKCKRMLFAFFWVDSPVTEFYMPTFRNTLSVQTPGNHPKEGKNNIQDTAKV